MIVDLEIALVFPVRHQHAIQDCGLALRFGDDRVVELARAVHPALVSDEVRLGVAYANEDPGSRPGRLEDVPLPFRSFADESGSLGQEVSPESGAQDSSIPALDMANVRSIMRTPVRNKFLGVHCGSRICAFSVLPSPGVPLPITTARRGGIRVMAGGAPRGLTPPRASTGGAQWRAPSRRAAGAPPLGAAACRPTA